MARTTALTTSAFAQLVANGLLRATGVVPPEIVGRDLEAYQFILGVLKRHAIVLSPELPFVR